MSRADCPKIVPEGARRAGFPARKWPMLYPLDSKPLSLMASMPSPKFSRRAADPLMESRREMTAAGESQSKGDLLNRQFRPSNQEVTSSIQASPQHVGVRRHSHTLTKSALEVTSADPRERGQRTQFDFLTERVFYVLENQFESPARQPSDRARRSCRQGRVAVNQVVREKLTSALGIQLPCWKSACGFARKTC